MPGLDSFTKLLLHMDGSDGSTTITDASSLAHTCTVRDEAQIDTAQSKFGGASGLFDSEGTDAVDLPVHADLVLGTGDWAVDFWYRPAATAPNGLGLFDYRWSGAAGTVSFALFTTVTAVPEPGRVRLFADGDNRIFGTTVLQANTWYHIALVQSSGVMRLFVNGAQEGSSYAQSHNWGNGMATGPGIGGRFQGGGSPCNGHIDEFRISKGTDRGWSGGFTPPAAAYAATGVPRSQAAIIG